MTTTHPASSEAASSDTPELHRLRSEVRAFLRDERESGRFVPSVDPIPSGYDPEFSRLLGAKGWIGVTWPTVYGGRGWSARQRFCITEELVSAGAPVGAHWIADRQSGPLILRIGTEEQRVRYLPAIARGELYFCIGMSEPQAGSDLSGLATRATEADEGWVLNGRKIWSSRAHVSHFMLALCRTDATSADDRRSGLSQFIVDLSLRGITISPIVTIDGEHHFNEVSFDDVHIPEDAILGTRGQGWRQSGEELASERGGPERFLSSFILLEQAVNLLLREPTVSQTALDRAAQCVARLWESRVVSTGIAERIDLGQDVAADAAAAKDVGTILETDIVEEVRAIAATLSPEHREQISGAIAAGVLKAPGFTISGGTTEILRSVVGRSL